MAKGKKILDAATGQEGTVTCTIRKVYSRAQLKKMTINPGDCLLIPDRDEKALHTEPADEPYLVKAAGFIADNEGRTCHLTISVSKRYGIPTLVLARDGDALLSEGQKVVIDGKVGMRPEQQKLPGGKFTTVMRPYGEVYEYKPGGDEPRRKAESSADYLSKWNEM